MAPSGTRSTAVAVVLMKTYPSSVGGQGVPGKRRGMGVVVVGWVYDWLWLVVDVGKCVGVCVGGGGGCLE